MKRWRILPAAPEHAGPIARNMREADRREVWASHRHTPEQALRFSLERSDLAWTCFVDHVPAFMWGAARMGSLVSCVGAPWLLGTDALGTVRREFLRQCPAFVGLMQKRFLRLENHVHAENTVSMRWLVWCGFVIEREPVIMNNERFFLFWRKRHV